jgi:DNA-binding beta-propeller fold protein YncE
VANTPDNRLEVFRLTDDGHLVHQTSVPVGLEPVAIAARSDSEVWVINHLSDSVSVVKLGSGGSRGRVVRTLFVGDEPRDIVFGGPGRSRAFITTAHRGQNIPFDPQLTTPGIGRADVWVFDAEHLGASLGGNPLTIITLFSDTPRALAMTPDGSRVYAAGFHTGNRTTTIFESLVPDGFGPARGVPGPSTNFEGIPAPETSIIVKFDGTHWVDELGRPYDDLVKFSLPDRDVFVIDAMANPPAQFPEPQGVFTGVGTILYNMIVNPVNGKVYVSNTEAQNDQSFEGPGIFAGHSVRGHLHENRITILSTDGVVTSRHLNKHINYGSCCAPIPNAENARSLALPLGMAITPDGATLYVAAMGSDKIGVYSTAALEHDTFVPSTADQIPVSGGGPTGLALHADTSRLYVLTRFDNAISIINTETRTEIGHVPMYNPEPASVVSGRRFLYDAAFTSSHGDSACASCHVFGDFDGLAWNLGNPDAPVVPNLNLSAPEAAGEVFFDFVAGVPIVNPKFHPMKGPMNTQSLRGMANHGPMHWRGDRTGADNAPSIQPDSGTFDERAAFKKFQLGFVNLLGRSEFIPDADMEAFTDFILQVTYPPNPIRALDNSRTPEQQAGHDLFMSDRVFDLVGPCTKCHTTDLQGNPGSAAPGFFGTSGLIAFDFQVQLFKAPHFRNLYQLVGKFGQPDTPFIHPGNNDFLGDQIRGFGYLHDGSIDTVFRFLSFFPFSPVFPGNPDGMPFTLEGNTMRRQLEAFLLASDSNLAPIVGQQVTLRKTNAAVAGPRINLLKSRADVGECDLVAKSHLGEHELGFTYSGENQFMSNRQAWPVINDVALRALAGVLGLEVTYTCTPPGSGVRIGIDRDSDGFPDGDEEDAGSDPADPASTP